MTDQNAERLVEANVQLLRAHRRHKLAWAHYIGLLQMKHNLLREMKQVLSSDTDVKVMGGDLKKLKARMGESRNKSVNALKDIAELQEEVMGLELLHDLDSNTFKISIGARYNAMFPDEPIKLESHSLTPVSGMAGIPAP